MSALVNINLLPWREKVRQYRINKFKKITILIILIFFSCIITKTTWHKAHKKTIKPKFHTIHKIKHQMPDQTAWKKSFLIKFNILKLMKFIKKFNSNKIKIKDIKINATTATITGNITNLFEWLRLINKSKIKNLTNLKANITSSNNMLNFKLSISSLTTKIQKNKFKFHINSPIKILQFIFSSKMHHIKINSIIISKRNKNIIFINISAKLPKLLEILNNLVNKNFFCPIKEINLNFLSSNPTLKFQITTPCYSTKPNKAIVKNFRGYRNNSPFIATFY